MDDTAMAIAELRAEISELRSELASLRAHSKPVEGAAPEMGGGDTTDGAAFAEPAGDRRGFLRLAGVAAVGATTAAIASVATAEPVAAATGDAWLIGVNSQSPNLPSERTRMFNPSSTVLAPSLVVSNNYSSGSPVNPPANHRAAIVGTTSGNDTDGSAWRTGVYGRTASPNASGQGVFGSADGVENTFTSFRFGVVGTAGDDGYGLFGFCPTGASSTGVLGRADSGTGVVASSSTGISLYVRDGGRVLQELRSGVGAPTSGTFIRGEMIRDLNADMYICVTGGAPGTWRKVTAQHPEFADAGGSINLLARPIRLVDSRGNGGAPITNGSARLLPLAPLLAQITGTVADSLSVPAGAKGVLGNLTATEPLGNGFALVWPGGQPVPATSNLNFGPATPAIANYFVSALDTAGRLNVMCAGASTHLIVDVFGFVF